MTPVHQELELKAVISDPDAFRERLRAAGAVPRFSGRMTDRRYDRAGELATRDEVLRVRTFHHPDGVEAILAWKGPTMRSPDGYKLREEIELPVSRASADPGRLLAALGYQPVHAIERDVEVYRLGGATARLETYPRMDVLLEVEGDPAAIEQRDRGERHSPERVHRRVADRIRPAIRGAQWPGRGARDAAGGAHGRGDGMMPQAGIPRETWDVPELGPSLGRLVTRRRRPARARSAHASTTSGSGW